MSRRCEICGKGGVRGNRILRRGQAKKKGGIGQHITAVTPRLFKPNLQVVHAIIDPDTGRSGQDQGLRELHQERSRPESRLTARAATSMPREQSRHAQTV